MVKKRLMRTVVVLAATACVLSALAGLWPLLVSPATAQQAPPAPADPVWRAYPCRPENAPAVAAQLQQEFGAAPNVRFASDQRVGQVLVQANPAVQAQVAQRLLALAAAASQPPNALSGTAPPTPPAPTSLAIPSARSHAVSLRHVPARQVEAALANTLGERLSAVTGAELGVRNYWLALPGGQRIELGISERANQVTVQGAGAAVDSCLSLIRALDSPQTAPDRSVRFVSVSGGNPASMRRAVGALSTSTDSRRLDGPLVTMLFQQPGQPQPAAPPSPPAPNGAAAPPDGPPAGAAAASGSMIGPVQIEWLEGLDVLVLRGHQRDVAQVMQLIEEIEQLSAVTAPAIELYPLRHVDCRALAELITPLYDEVFSPRQGSVSITALGRPNALLLIGRPESVQTALDLVKRLDQPVAGNTQFRVFRLRHLSAETAQETLTTFFEDAAEDEGRGGLVGTSVLVIADYRSNAIVVRANPRDMAEAAALIERLDTATSEAVNLLRIFQIRNSPADELATTLQEALGAQQTGARTTGQAFGPGGQQATRGTQGTEQRSTMLKFLSIDANGQRQLQSGILADVKITPDIRANTLLVSAPADSMELIATLIGELDKLPAAEALIKVFMVENSDALTLLEMLETLFAEEANEPAVRTGVSEGESSLVRLRFAVDARTNSIVATGSMGDLKVVEAILLRLDDSEARKRQNKVYRLKNAPATEVAAAINNFLSSEREVQELSPGMSPFEQIEREVVVVPEDISNTLILSATPRFFEEIEELIEELDARPPMVMIQVLIAEISLNDTDEFGVELGLQDSLLFDRSLLGDLLTTTETTYDAVTGLPVAQTQIIQSATNTPGYAFNNQPLGNSGSNNSVATAGTVGSQGLSHFGVGRLNSELGFGGLVLSASSEAVSILVRALQDTRRLEVLSRPQIMTMDNQPAWIQVGAQVPYIRGTTLNETGQVNTIDFEEVGLILGVRPRISPDGMVVMEIDAVKSELGPESEGIPVSISVTGDVIRSPQILKTQAQTTVSAMDGQTVVLGGLITKNKAETHRRVPLLADIPVLGNLFRYDLVTENRTELLIIMTPHVVDSVEDGETLKQEEMARMHWCLCDVLELGGGNNLRTRSDEWLDSETNVVYPDLNSGGEPTPAPDGAMSLPGYPAGAPAPTLVPLPTAPLSQPTPAAGVGLPLQRGYPAAPSGGLEQARYRPSASPGGIMHADYRGPEASAAGPYRGSGPVVASPYNAPWPQQPRPASTPAPGYGPPAPVQSAASYTPLYR